MELDLGIINLLLCDLQDIFLMIKALLIPTVAFVYGFIMFSTGCIVYVVYNYVKDKVRQRRSKC